MTTPLYTTFKKRIDDAVNQLVKQQVTPWSFLTAGHPFRIKKHDGSQITYQGIEFEGSPREVFWSRYIEPFLEELCVKEITAAVSIARNRGVNVRLLLIEVEELLLTGIKKVYTKMSDVDQRLRGKGYPNKVKPKPVNQAIDTMSKFIDERIHAEIAMCKSRSRLEEWYKNNQFLVWIIGIIVTIFLAFLGFR